MNEIRSMMKNAAYFQTEIGGMFLADSLEIMQGIDNGRVNLIMTSPPFGLVRKKSMGTLIRMIIWTGSGHLLNSFIEF